MAIKFNSSELQLTQMIKLKTSANEIIRGLYEKGAEQSSILKSIELSDGIVNFIKSEDYIDAARVFKDYQPFALTHPFIVSLVSVMICKKLDWNTDRTMKAVALGGLLHNIGMIKMPDNLKYQRPEELSNDDLKIYKTHPEVGMEILGGHPEVPASVLQIVYQHHELGGQGYPMGLSDLKIFPLAKVVNFADKYSKYILENDLMMVDGLKPFLNQKDEIIRYDPDLVRALIKSFIKDDKARLKS